MLFSKNNKDLKSTYIVDKKTKNLLSRINQNQIAIINHSDVDEIAALGLIERRVKAIINFSLSMSGTYPTFGLEKLLKARIPIFDVKTNQNIFNELRDNNEVIINPNTKTAKFTSPDKTLVCSIEQWTSEKFNKVFKQGNSNLEQELNRFINNTLEYALKEKDFVLKPMAIPALKTKINGKHVVVVVRGNNYREDLVAIRSYIEDYRPILIGVDGGADALIEYGLQPHIIIGDMDSVSDKALKSGAEIIVHAYPDGTSPGMFRVNNIGLDAKIIPSVGTSEDIAMLMAFEKQAELIVALGAHSNMVDFLEKGRKGMASTVLVRMKIGTKLIDAKGVSKLYHPRTKFKDVSLIGIAAITPIIAISLVNHDMVRILQIVWMNIKMLFT